MTPDKGKDDHLTPTKGKGGKDKKDDKKGDKDKERKKSAERKTTGSKGSRRNSVQPASPPPGATTPISDGDALRYAFIFYVKNLISYFFVDHRYKIY